MSSEMKNKIIQRHFCSVFGILMIEHGQCLIFTVKYKLQPVPRAGVFPADVETYAQVHQPYEGQHTYYFYDRLRHRLFLRFSDFPMTILIRTNMPNDMFHCCDIALNRAF